VFVIENAGTTVSDLKSKIQYDMKEAMRAKDVVRLSTIRLLLAAIKQREIDTRQDGQSIALTDADILQLINKMIKQRSESAKQFRGGHRPELAEKEEQEIKELETYLPAQLSTAEIEVIIKETIASVGATGIKDMSLVMGALKLKLQSRADMAVISTIVKKTLSG